MSDFIKSHYIRFATVTVTVLNFVTVLQDFSDYNDPEAFEVWGRSLVKEKDYLTAQKKVTLALKYAKVCLTVQVYKDNCYCVFISFDILRK